MKTIIANIFAIGLVFVFIACKKKGFDDKYDIPKTYNFQNVNYAGQTTRLEMLGEMVSYMKTGNDGIQLDAQKLIDMYANENGQFTDASLNTATKQLKNKTFELDRDIIEGYLDSLAAISGSIDVGSNGTAGIVTSNDDSKSYLLNANGMEYTQLVEKGLMGALMYYQIAEVYFSDDKIGPSVDNTTTNKGEGTAMEHHWDEAFGYFGVPLDFPANTSGMRFIGKYSNSRDALLNTDGLAMCGFLKGRAAISSEDMETKDEAVIEVKTAIEKVFVGTAIHYLNGANNNFADDALRNHQLSEFIAFLKSLKYNSDRIITDAQITEVLSLIGNNLYEVTSANITHARDMLSTIYGLDNIKNAL